MSTPTRLASTLALLVTLTLTGCAGEAEDAASPTTSTPTAAGASPTAAPPATSASPEAGEAPAATTGSWVDLADYEADRAGFHDAGDVVLFFNADWCPTCQATVASLESEGTPPGLTVVSVDFDDSDALRQQYGVTVQHTFVQVDVEGAELATFTGSASGADIAAATV
jgi:thiol-disulfide isomerase/thioredoxin